MYIVEQGTNDYVIDGFERGIADTPHTSAQPLLGQYGLGGISDMKNVQIISVPGEASVNFSTAAVSPIVVGTGTVSSVNGSNVLTYTGAVGLENYMAIQFNASGLTIGAVSAAKTYWVALVSGGTFKIYSDYGQTALVLATNGVGTFTIASVGTNLITGATGAPQYFTFSPTSNKYYMQDATGAVWSNTFLTASGFWTYLGPSGTADTNSGKGLVCYPGIPYSSGHNFIFVFNSLSIDYWDETSLAWTWGWNPATDAIHQASGYIGNSNVGGGITSHEALLAPDGRVYFCDGLSIGSFYQTSPTTAFDPTNLAGTYTYNYTRLLPMNDVAQCLSYLGTNLMIGGKLNVIYPWDRFSTTYSYPILLAEYNIVKMLTVNTNTYVLVGNRGRIYITNGSQATLYKKIPDHISQTIEPYYTWGGLCSNKNQLYFSFYETKNDGTALTTSGGVWGIDLDTKAIRLTNTLSYQTTLYNGYATALISIYTASPAGTGLFIGWDSKSLTYGIDTTSSSPYTGTTPVAFAVIDSDLIPMGTYLRPTTTGRVEFKLSTALVAGESVQLYYRQSFSASFAAINAGASGNGLFNVAGVFSGVCQNVNFQNSQWIQIRATLQSTASSPSFVRLTELRIGN
jgi:hypothetical protein